MVSRVCPVAGDAIPLQASWPGTSLHIGNVLHVHPHMYVYFLGCLCFFWEKSSTHLLSHIYTISKIYSHMHGYPHPTTKVLDPSMADDTVKLPITCLKFLQF